MLPETRYALAGNTHIAYQVLGNASLDLVLADQWFSHMDGQWDVAPMAELRHRLAEFSRVILFDRRGVGQSDPVAIDASPPIETWMDDLLAVMDAASSERAAIVTNIGGALTGLVFAASHPNRVTSLVVVDGFARYLAAPDYPIGESAEEAERQLKLIEMAWGRGQMLDMFAPSMRGVEGLRDTWARYERVAASPGTARATVRNIYQSDVRDVLPSIRVPTLVIQHPQGSVFRPELGRYIADRIPGCRYVELPGPDQLIWAGDQAATVAEIEELVTGHRSAGRTNRVLATILFTDLVGSTEMATTRGDQAWRSFLVEHEQAARRSVGAAGGRLVKTTGDGFVATFDRPARAITAALTMRESVGRLGAQMRAGLHTGEIELLGDDVAGVAVHVAARVSALAGAGEVLVSSTVKDLVVGSGLQFDDRGSYDLRGVPGQWRLYAVGHVATA